MLHVPNFYHQHAAPKVDGSAILSCSSTRIWRNRHASRSLFGISGSSPYQSVICHL
jgi:hypothetical protein